MENWDSRTSSQGNDLERGLPLEASHSLLIHALCISKVMRGQRDEALELAKVGVRLLLERGELRLAAEVYREFPDAAAVFLIPFSDRLAITRELMWLNAHPRPYPSERRRIS